jgi:geranylgeranyl diphosphate synthase type II
MQSIEELYLLFEDFRKSSSFGGKVAELYSPANYLMDLGGKRMRPLLTLLSHQLWQVDTTPSLTAALAIEVFHNFSLMHDDIMDASPLRRGQPTVHKKYNTNAAILSGDWMLIHTYELLNKYPGPLNRELITLMNKTATEVCEGQQLDINFESRLDVSESEYVEMIKNKTAVLLGAAMQIGGMICNASDEDLRHLYDAGLYLGLSFQLRDDYLDVFSPESGKIKGGDIHQNKKTLLFIHCLQQLGITDKTLLLSYYSQNNMDKVQEVTELFKKSKSDEYVKSMAVQYGVQAFDALDKIAVPEKNKSNLRSLFQTLLNRNS